MPATISSGVYLVDPSTEIVSKMCIRDRYTAEEWEDLCADGTSYAAWIARKGQVIYESTT